jgi:hypothetical protein
METRLSSDSRFSFIHLSNAEIAGMYCQPVNLAAKGGRCEGLWFYTSLGTYIQRIHLKQWLGMVV